MNDQLPFLARSRFSALPTMQKNVVDSDDNNKVSLFIAILYVIDTFGVFPFITLPSLLVELGILGVPLVLSVVAMQIYTSFLLSRCWTMAESLDPSIKLRAKTPYVALADVAYGRFLSRFVRILLHLSIIAMRIPNIIVAADSLHLAGLRITNGSYSLSYCYMVLIVGLFITFLMWISSARNIRALSFISVCVVVILVILLWFCLFTAMPLGGEPFEGVNFGLPYYTTVLNGYSVIAFQFDMHPMLLTLKIDMQHKSLVGWAAFSGVTATTTVAIIGSCIAAYKFGSMVAENVLETLPPSGTLEVLLILIALQLCFSTAVGSFTMFQQIENYLRIPEGFSFKKYLIRISVLSLEVIIAEMMPKFDALMEIVGGTIIGPLIFIIPPLLYLRIRKMEQYHRQVAIEASYGSIPLDLNFEFSESDDLQPTKSRSVVGIFTNLNLCQTWRCHKSFSLAILIFGILATFLSTFLNIFRLDEIIANNSPCYSKNFTI